MKKRTYLAALGLVTFMLFCNLSGANAETVCIYGQVTDFNGNPIDSAVVLIKDKHFEDQYTTFSGPDGYYELEVEAGHYASLASVRMQDYGKTKLEYWAWNLHVEEDMELPIRYDKLEVYGVNVFRVQGAYPGYTIYFRPMALSRYYADAPKGKSKDLAPEPENMDLSVTINGAPVKVNLIQQIKEYTGKAPMTAYLIHTDLEQKRNQEITEFHIVVEDKQYGDKGEAHFFYKN